jgi:hypothetical protein
MYDKVVGPVAGELSTLWLDISSGADKIAIVLRSALQVGALKPEISNHWAASLLEKFLATELCRERSGMTQSVRLILRLQTFHSESGVKCLSTQAFCL